MRGGKAIASGAYGCVFKPQLPCSNGDRVKSGISKLMEPKEARKEESLVKLIRRRLAHIPNIEKYTVLDDIKLCTPGNISSEDFVNLNKECSFPLNKTFRSRSEFNVNKHKYSLVPVSYTHLTLPTILLV